MSGKINKSWKKLVCVGILILALAGCAKANLVNSNSIVQDEIEYYIQTDKAVYNLGQEVEMLHRVTNLGTEELIFEFAYQQQNSFEIWEGQERIWGWPKLVNPAIRIGIVPPGESMEFLKSWDMIDDNGILIDIGVYNVLAELIMTGRGGFIPESVSVPIEIIPEPATLGLLGIGLVGLLTRKRKK